MLISVIIPVYQGRHLLEKCIKSIPDEYCDKVEIILADDGSTDGSAELCDVLAAGRKNVYAFHQENQGVSAARNLGLKKANGKYVMFIDADDEFVDEQWPLIISYAEKEHDFVAFSYYSWFANGNLIEEPFPHEAVIGGRDEFMKVLLGTPLLHTCWGKLFRRKLIEAYDISFPSGVSIGEDYIFVMEYCKHIQTQVLVNECVMKYFQNPTGAMGSFNLEKRLKCLELIWNYCNNYTSDERSEKYREDMCEYQLYSMISVIRAIASNLRGINRYRDIKNLMNAPTVKEIVGCAPVNRLVGHRKAEYFLVKNRMVLVSTLYFGLKAVLVNVKKGMM